MCLYTQPQEQTISIHTYTNEFGMKTVRIDYGPIRFIITSPLRPVLHHWMSNDNETITIMLYFELTQTKLYFRFLATEHRRTNNNGERITIMIDYQLTGMCWCVYFSSLATSHTHQHCLFEPSKGTPYSIPVPESEWGRRNRERSELVLDWQPPPHEVYKALTTDTSRNPPQSTSPLLPAPIQESQPYDQTKSEAVFPSLQL